MFWVVNILAVYIEAPNIKGSELKKLEKASILSFGVLFTSEEDCRSCEDAIEEWNDVYASVKEYVDLYQMSCSEKQNQATCEKYGITKFPALRVFAHNGQIQAPAEYFGRFESDRMEDFVMERIREPFSKAMTSEALLDFMLMKTKSGIFFFVNTPSKKPERFLYQFGKKYFGKAQLIVQSNTTIDEFEKYRLQVNENITDKLQYGEINLWVVMDGIVQFYPYPIDAEEPDLVLQWAQEIIEYATSPEFRQRQGRDEEDDDF